jgi:hypothetical protein
MHVNGIQDESGGQVSILGGCAITLGDLSVTGAGTFTNSVTAASLHVGANQVVGARNVGYTAMTGVGDAGTVFDTTTVTLPQLASRVKALQAALTTHGLVGT